MFDEQVYLAANPDVEAAVKTGAYTSGRDHYDRHGRNERRPGVVPIGFDTMFYLANNPDIAAAVEDGLVPTAADHYATFGWREGRAYSPPDEHEGLGGGIFGPHVFRYPFRAYNELPRFVFGAPSRGNDGEIASRLIAAWQLAEMNIPDSDLVDREGMWSILPNRHPLLFRALRNADVDGLADLLANVFQQHITHGIAMGRATTYMAQKSPRQFSMNWCDRLLRLAEAVGARPVRSPEQGDFQAPLEMEIAETISAIEEIIGMSLGFPQVGGAFGVLANGTPFPELSFSHIYAAHRINQRCSGNSFVEIGGGIWRFGLFHATSSKNVYYSRSSILKSYPRLLFAKGGSGCKLVRGNGCKHSGFAVVAHHG